MSETVKLKFEKFSGFITEYASNISLGGMFIKSDEPKSIGSELHFEITLSDGFKLVKGTGEVAWTRSESQGPEKPAGMGIRFHELDDTSRELIDKMVYHRLMDGGKPFELEQAFEGQKMPQSEAPVPEPEPAPPTPAFEAPAAAPAWRLEPAPTAAPEAGAQAELPGMGELPSLELPGGDSFSSLESSLEDTPSSQVQPPPDMVEPDALGVSAPTLSAPSYEAPMLAESDLPDSELPGLGEPELTAPELPPEAELSPVSLPGGFGEPPAPPAPPPGAVSYPEPSGQALDDSLFSMDRSMLGGPSAADQAAPPALGSSPALPSGPAELPSEPGFAPPASTVPSFAPTPAPLNLPEDDWDDEDDDLDAEEPRRGGLLKLLVPVAAVLVLAAAGYFLRDLWMPLIPGGEEVAAVESESMAAPEEQMAEPEETTRPEPEVVSVGADPGPTRKNIPPPPPTEQIPPPSDSEPPPGSTMTGIDRITWKAEPGGLRVTLWADGRLASGSVTHHHLGGGTSRELLKVRGVARPFTTGALSVGDGRVSQIRTGYHEKPDGNELHVVFDLTSDAITVREIDTSGSTIVLVLN